MTGDLYSCLSYNQKRPTKVRILYVLFPRKNLKKKNAPALSLSRERESIPSTVNTILYNDTLHTLVSYEPDKNYA